MWRYYQTSHNKHEDWKPCEDSQAKEIAEKEALHMSMLSVSIPHSEDADYDKAKYYGDLVIDIDHGDSKEDTTTDEAIQKSIHSAQLVVEFLESRVNTNHLKLYASGKKGFHIHIPAETMLPKKAGVRNLPAIYKQMVKHIEVATGASGIDYSLYAAKRGHLVRLPNKERKEGTYKVQVSPAELSLLTPERYVEFCKAPRPALSAPDNIPTSMGLRAMMDQASVAVEKQKSLALGNKDGISDEMLEGFGVDDHPECVKRMAAWTHQKTDKTFNELAIQMAIYVRAAQVPESEQQKLVGVFAERGHSTTYSTAEARKRHVFIEVTPSINKMRFSCGAMRGCVDMKGGCTGCPVQQKVEGDITQTTGIEEDDDGYSFVTSEGVSRRLTNFHINISEFYLPQNHIGKLSAAWTGAKLDVFQRGEFAASLDVNKDVFTSATKFNEVFEAITTGVRRVNDNDVANLRDFLWANHKGKAGMRVSSSIGIQPITYIPEDSDEPITVMTWVEDGWAMATNGMTGGVKLNPAPAKNCVKHERREHISTIRAEHENTLMHLMGCSDPATVGMMLGWVVAATAKEHIIDRVREFPLLHIQGIAGSGKTSMASMFAALGSADYRDRPGTAENMTAFPLRELSFTSTTVPRILDECNKPKIAVAKWNVVREILKATYQRSAISIGGISHKKSTTDTHHAVSYSERATSPIIYLSTSATDEQELWERSLEVMLTKANHFVDEYKANFDAINSNNGSEWENLFDVARMIMVRSLRRDVEALYTNYEGHLNSMPNKFDMRTRKAYAYVFYGLDYFYELMESYGATKSLLSRIKEISTAAADWLEVKADKLHERKSRTEVDNFFERVIQTVSRIDNNGNQQLRKGVHYLRADHILYLDGTLVFGEYRATCRWLGQMAEFNNIRQVQDAMEGAPFYLGEDRVPNPQGMVLTWLKFDIRALEERGHDFSRFEQT